MVTYTFKCKECNKEFAVSRMGMKNFSLWKENKYKVECPSCKSTKIEFVPFPKGSGQWKRFKIYDPI